MLKFIIKKHQIQKQNNEEYVQHNSYWSQQMFLIEPTYDDDDD